MEIKNYNRLIIRAPYLPIETYFNITNKVKSVSDLNIELKDLFKDEKLQKAVFLASPALFKESFFFDSSLCSYSLRKEIKDKTLLALFRYIARMASRCTPFGLFAGYAILSINSVNDIKIGDRARHRENYHLDMGVSSKLYEWLIKDQNIRKTILYYPNNSLYKVSSSYRYFEYSIVSQSREYKNVNVESNVYLDEIINKAKEGTHFNKLIKVLTERGINLNDATKYINDLIDNQILISEIELNISGEEYVKRIYRILGELKIGKTNILKDIVNVGNTNVTFQDCLRLEKYLNDLLSCDIREKTIFQCDLQLSLDKHYIDSNLVDLIKKDVTSLWKLSNINTTRDLLNFKARFIERYGDSEVSLSEALDPDLGIGYGNSIGSSPLIEPIDFGSSLEIENTENNQDIELWKLNFILKSKNNNQVEVEITDTDLNSFKTNFPLPEGFYVIGSLLLNRSDNKSFSFVLNHFGGPSGAMLLSRFGITDNHLESFLSKIVNEEAAQKPDAQFAEIIHLPQGRTGNILRRPKLRKSEIAYLGKGALENEEQIKISEIKLSIRNDKLIFRSVKTNKQIIPRLTSAHNFSINNLPIYRFLCDSQYESCGAGFFWNWGALASVEFLPRIRYKNIIVSKAIWNIELKDFPFLNDYNKFSEPRKVDIQSQFSELLTCNKKIPTKVTCNRKITMYNFRKITMYRFQKIAMYNIRKMAMYSLR